MTSGPDFVVIGAGIAGASAAYELSALGEVLLYERETVAGYHTTGRSAALFTEAWETGLWRSLATASRPFLDTPPAGFAEYPILSSLPVLIIGREDQRHLVEEISAAAAETVVTELLGGSQAAELCPILRPGYVDIALLEPGAMNIDVDLLHQGYLRGIRKRGGTVALGHRVDLIERVDGGWRVGAGATQVTAPVLVNAAGAWCDEVAALADIPPIGLVPKRRTAFTFPAPEGVDPVGMPMVIDAAVGFYFKPEAGQFLGSLAEATPMEPQDVRPEEIDVALAIERIQNATTLNISHVRRTWAGLRSFVDDELPVVGEDPLAPGFYWLAGQGGAGIMTSPAMAQLLAALVATGDTPVHLRKHGIEGTALSVRRLSRGD